MIKNIFRRIREALAQWIFDSHAIRKWRTETYQTVDKVIDDRLDSFHEQLRAFQAIDHNYNDYGHIVLCMQVGNQDFVKIIQVQPKVTLAEYKEIVGHIERAYGIKPQFIDSCVHIASYFMDIEKY